MDKFSKTTGVCLLAALSVSGLGMADTLTDTAPSLMPRIVGGVVTEISQVPATVALLRSNRVLFDGDLFQAQFCGGTVIAPRWVLTAAHCVINSQGSVITPASIMVLTGSDDLDSPVNQPIAVTTIIAHAEYESVEEGRDIALIQLELDAQVEPAPINTIPIGIDEPAFIAGWGAINSIDDVRVQSFPNKLRGAFVNVSEGASCGLRYPDYNGFTDETNLCAGVPQGGRDSCQGDSGGPLYSVDSLENRVTAVTGITSWGIGCGVAANPGIYTDVASYANWIRSNMQAVESPTQPPPADDAIRTDPIQSPSTLPSNDDAPIASDDGDNSEPGGLFNGDEHVLGRIPWVTSFAMLVTLLIRRRSK